MVLNGADYFLLSLVVAGEVAVAASKFDLHLWMLSNVPSIDLVLAAVHHFAR